MVLQLLAACCSCQLPFAWRPACKAAAKLLYKSALVAERYSGICSFLKQGIRGRGMPGMEVDY